MTTSPRLPRMRRLRLLSAALAGAALSAALPATAPAQTGVVSAMSCLAQTDAAGIDAMLARAGSPLAGRGVDLRRPRGRPPESTRAPWWRSPPTRRSSRPTGPPRRSTTPSASAPGIAFATDAEAIARAARTLGAYYVAEGRTTLSAIGAKWAPIGVANDPGNLNANWTAGVGAYYAALGGDPAQPILTSAQAGRPGVPRRADPLAAGRLRRRSGRPARRHRLGRRDTGRRARPAARAGPTPPPGRPPSWRASSSPSRSPVDAPAAYRDSFSDPGPTECDGGRRQCAVTIASAPGEVAVAMVAGTLRAANPAEAERGIAFWIETPAGDRLGYGPLASYDEGIGEGAVVAPGSPLGAVAGWVRIAWERGGTAINPYPLLAATRPPNG